MMRFKYGLIAALLTAALPVAAHAMAEQTTRVVWDAHNCFTSPDPTAYAFEGDLPRGTVAQIGFQVAPPATSGAQVKFNPVGPGQRPVKDVTFAFKGKTADGQKLLYAIPKTSHFLLVFEASAGQMITGTAEICKVKP